MENYLLMNASNESDFEIELEDIKSQEQNSFKKNNVIKIIVTGWISGSTSLMIRYIHNKFIANIRRTIGADFYQKDIIYNDDKIYTLQLWDISSSGIYSGLARLYYQGSNAAIIMFDLNFDNSFYYVQRWLDDINSKVKTSENLPIPCLLIGNKCDITDEISPEIQEKIDNLISTNQIIGFFKTSCLNGTNVKESIDFIANYVIENNIQPNFEYEPKVEKDTCICQIC